MLYQEEWNAFARRWRLLAAYANCIERITNSYDDPVDKLAAIRLVTATLHETDKTVPMNVMELILGELHLTDHLPPYEQLLVLVED